MITENGKYYLYRHIRLDKNEPFYIGVGTKIKKGKSFSTIYKRANDNGKRRGRIWRNITNKTEYRVEILFESDDYDFLLKREIEFIKLYGRIDLKTGILSNLTDGGEGTIGVIHSKERNEKISKANKGKIKSEIEKLSISKRFKKKIINTTTNEVFESIIDVSNYEKITYSTFIYHLHSRTKGFNYQYVDKKNWYTKKERVGIGNSGVKIRNKETKEIFERIKDAAIIENIELSIFYRMLNWKTKYFKYERI